MAVTLGSTGITINATTYTGPPTDNGVAISVTTFTASGTYTVPANATKLHIQVVGGGGGSAGYCESGGAGGYAEGVYTVTPGQAYTVTVGGGGAGVGYYAAAGRGGTSSFGTLITATGGYGANQNVSHGGGQGGVGTGGQVNLSGGTGSGHANSTGVYSAPAWGGGSYFGGGGSTNREVGPLAGSFSAAPGGGAAGSRDTDGSSGSAGASGIVIVYAFQ